MAIEHQRRRGEAYCLEALALAQPRNMRPLVAHCHFGLGRLYRQLSRPQLACEYHDIAPSMANQMDIILPAQQVESDVGQSL